MTIDGIHLGQTILLVALGIDRDGYKARARRMGRHHRERSTNPIENLNGTIRRVTRDVKRWRDASMALRWGATVLIEAERASEE